MFGHLILREYEIDRTEISKIWRRNGKIWQINTTDGMSLIVASAKEEENKILLVGAELTGIHLSEIDIIWVKRFNILGTLGIIGLGIIALTYTLFALGGGVQISL